MLCDKNFCSANERLAYETATLLYPGSILIMISLGLPNWQLWSYDPATGESGPIDAVDWNSGAIIHSQIGDQVYSMVPGADYASTVVYELGSAQDASAVFGITGWSFRLFQVR